MKGLTLIRPWPDAIATMPEPHAKRIENRSWRERGRLGYRAALWERSSWAPGGWRLVGTGEGRTRSEAEDAARVPQLEAA